MIGYKAERAAIMARSLNEEGAECLREDALEWLEKCRQLEGKIERDKLIFDGVVKRHNKELAELKGFSSRRLIYRFLG